MLHAQEIDRLIEQESSVFCNCITEISTYESKDDLSDKLQRCSDIYPFTKSDSLLVSNFGEQEYELELFTRLLVDCCALKKIFSAVTQESIEKKTIKQEAIDSMKVKELIGESLKDNISHFNSFSETILVKITAVQKDSCGYPSHIYASSNGVTFRVSTVFDDAVKVSEDEFLLEGLIQEKGDGLYVKKNALDLPFFFVRSVINLSSLESKRIY
ncbi:hypothetical protein DNU06_09010 [Putridiphycobacter roseus]|uniref:Uncharacterized protein n=1 Tax=Putridiphycobacter roseus TaxID=2219161 RepID=A0A2W1MYW9_9FLAO|nr:hypothetical protein DNU06_09010 [Putridiphycobacter roseus]